MTEAASSRFRPIRMTSMCTILGVVPIALALGAGAESRASMGIAVIGGLSAGTAPTRYVSPSFYLLLQGRRQKIPATTLEAETKNPDQLAPPVEIPESVS
jgi:multidrug efflux pump